MANQYEDRVKREWEKLVNETHYPNIMLLGVTGCGKSSLINTIFKNDKLARVSNTSRGTESFDCYYGKDFGLSINLIDSKGYEMSNGEDTFEAYLESVIEWINSNKNKMSTRVHLVWFCISVAGERIQDYDIKMLNELNKIPELKGKVAVAFTKCDQDDEDGSTANKFRGILRDKAFSGLHAFEVSNDPTLPLEIEELVNWSINALADTDLGLRDAFISSQMIDLDSKRKKAAGTVAGFAAGAAAIGATPLPFADAALLVPDQMAMVVAVVHIYGLDSFAGVSKAVIGDVLVTTIGRSLATGLIKLIPIVGPIVGSVVNAGVAATITCALGFAISEICYNSCKEILNGGDIDFTKVFNKEDIQDLMKSFMAKNKKSSVDDMTHAIEGGKERL